jgi:hypothetical protein
MTPLAYRWSGDSFQILPRHAKLADQQFVIGEIYTLEQVFERTSKSHNHEFAWLADAWKNLPERFDNEPWAQSPEHLRKFGLIRCKFCTTETFACGSNAEAMRWAPRLRADDEYCIVSVSGSVVHRFRAESQSRRSMGAKRFQESKAALMEFVSDLIAVNPAALERAET